MRRAHRLPLLFGTTAMIAIAVGCATGSIEDATLATEDTPHDAAGDRSTHKSLPDSSPSDVSPSGDDDDDDDNNGVPQKDGGPAKDASVDAGSDAKIVSDASYEAGPDANAIDAGFDAGDAGHSKPAQGEIVISEVMYNPLGAEPGAEWVEIYNTSSSARSLSGLVLRDGSNRSHTILPGVVVSAGAYVVLASLRADAVASKVPDAVIVYEYNAGSGTAVQLANGSGGAVVLLDGATEVARANYGALGLSSSSNGQSIQLKALDYASAGVKAKWCYSPTAWAVGSGKGTPGAPSDCP